MTATLAPLRLAVPAAPYWDTLDEADRLGSINSHKSRPLGRKTGWFPAGVTLQKWTEEIYPTITKIINDPGNYETIFGKHNKEVTRPCWLYMVGEGQQWMAARPTIVAICSKTRIAQRICGLLQNISCMKSLNLGFDYMHHREKIVLVTGDNERGLPYSSATNWCGHTVLASTYPPSLDAKWKPTTIGGVLKINHRGYCLTVAHAFHLAASEAGGAGGGSGSSADSATDSDDSDDYHPASHSQLSVSMVACPPNVIAGLRLGLYLDRMAVTPDAGGPEGETRHTPLNMDNIHVVGAGVVNLGPFSDPQTLLLCAELDWALVPASDAQLHVPNVVQGPSGTILSPQRVSISPPHGKVLVAAGVSGVFDAYCCGVVGGLSLPGSSRMVDVWTIDSRCLPGDCGSWVIDAITGDLYGIIVATAPEAHESYMITASQVYESIRSRLPEDAAVEFPTSDLGSFSANSYPPVSPVASMEPSTDTIIKPETDAFRSQAIPTTSLPDSGEEVDNKFAREPEFLPFDWSSPQMLDNRYASKHFDVNRDNSFTEEWRPAPEVKTALDEWIAEKEKVLLSGDIKETPSEAALKPGTSDYPVSTAKRTTSSDTPLTPSTIPDEERIKVVIHGGGPLGSNTTCRNCRTATTRLWRESDDGSILCNDCGMKETRFIETRRDTKRPTLYEFSIPITPKAFDFSESTASAKSKESSSAKRAGPKMGVDDQPVSLDSDKKLLAQLAKRTGKFVVVPGLR